ncbi:hypothetical protein, partial [Billgrantia aerodenitrificans]|uniref:hypothetical protein n=1 Tax=Billgrantia aerodenitrificans TaxID=2733483 RepID=UPI001F2A35DD
AGVIVQTLLHHQQLEPLIVSIAHKNTPKVGLGVQLSGCSSAIARPFFVSPPSLAASMPFERVNIDVNAP